ncbi:MAG: hypothetical protein ACKOWF_05690, partial [Chloroflexota bacterium]
MTTRATLRADLRLRLEDTGASPLWDDATLNAALAGAILRYGGIVPREATATAVAAAGDRRLTPAAGTVDPARITRVRDPAGAAVARWRDDDRPGDRAQGWRWREDGLDLAMPAAAGTWSIDYRAGRAAPGDDAAPAAVLPGDEGAVVALAVALALDRRAVEEAKRGGSGAAGAAGALRALAAA